MNKLTARFTVTTPMFLGGADNNATAELREFSFRGVLRFWWRALAWHRYPNNLKAMREAETALFGSADHGQGAFLMNMRLVSGGQVAKAEEVPFGLDRRDGARYLGYGLMVAYGSKGKGTQTGQLTRPCIAPQTEFEIDILFRSLRGVPAETHESYRTQLIDALKAMGLLGGLGSRSRKGFGSITLVSLTDQTGQTLFIRPQTEEAYSQEIRTLLASAKAHAETPDFSAFNADTRIDILMQDRDPMALIDLTGKAMIRYRSYGNRGQILGRIEAEQNFLDDHHLFHNYASGKISNIHTHPKRATFGLPHNYRFSSLNGIIVNCSPDKTNRRASPLFFHVHALNETSFLMVSTILPCRFLPENMQLGVSVVENKRTIRSTSVKPYGDYSVLYQFLEGHEGPYSRKTNTPYFPKRKQVLP